jgi:hypothetical protein
LGMWIGFIWLRIGTGGGLLWTWWWTFGFHKMRGISWLAEHTLSFLRMTLLHGVRSIINEWCIKIIHAEKASITSDCFQQLYHIWISDRQVALAVYRKVTQLVRNPHCIWVVMNIVSMHWTSKIGAFLCT